MYVGGNTNSTAMRCFGAKAILSSYGVLIEVQSRGEKFRVFSEFFGTHM